MQTFLPYDDMIDSLTCLDNKRLGKQRVEALQLIKGQWPNHPASKMWRNYRTALIRYYNFALDIWKARGFKNILCVPLEETEEFILPHWWGGPIHKTHRAALLAKNYKHYSQFNWPECPEINYVWPID